MFDCGNQPSLRQRLGTLFAQSSTCKVWICHYGDVDDMVSGLLKKKLDFVNVMSGSGETRTMFEYTRDPSYETSSRDLCCPLVSKCLKQKMDEVYSMFIGGGMSSRSGKTQKQPTNVIPGKMSSVSDKRNKSRYFAADKSLIISSGIVIKNYFYIIDVFF